MATHPANKLSERKQRFAEAYAGPAQGNGVQAATMAGYTGTNASLRVTASRLLKEPRIAAVIANISEKVANAAAAKASDVDRGKIADAMERREILSKLVRAGRNRKFGLLAVKASEVLNKMDGLYIQKHEVTGPVQVIASPSDERL